MQASSQKQREEDGLGTWIIGAWSHAFLATALLVGSIVLISVAHGYGIEKRLDFVTLYKYEKAVADKDKAVDAVKSAAAQQMVWLGDKTDAGHCLDLSQDWFPGVRFVAATTPIKADCQISLSVALGSSVGSVKLVALTGNLTGCAAGTYPVEIVSKVGESAGTPPNVVITAGKTLAAGYDAPFGWDYHVNSPGFVTCRDNRKKLADDILVATKCDKGGLASPLCACVQTFTNRLTGWTAKLSPYPEGKMTIGDVLTNGVKRCIELRRGHDVRKPVKEQYARSRAYLVFSIALFFNAVIAGLNTWKYVKDSVWVQPVFLVLYFGALIGAGIADGDGTGEYGTVLAMVLPAFIVHGGYGLFLKYYFENSDADVQVVPAPYLHPVTFDVCLCCLSVFTLVERGVVQYEYLIIEIFKCHAIGAVYIAICWYRRYGRTVNADDVLGAESVQQAFLMLYLVGMIGACSNVIVPYSSRSDFALHWVLPGSFTYLAFSNTGLAHHLQLATKLKSGQTVVCFNDIAAVASLVFGAFLWGYFLQEHLQVYGSSKFPYPMGKDPLAPVTLRLIA